MLLPLLASRLVPRQTYMRGLTVNYITFKWQMVASPYLHLIFIRPLVAAAVAVLVELSAQNLALTSLKTTADDRHLVCRWTAEGGGKGAVTAVESHVLLSGRGERLKGKKNQSTCVKTDFIETFKIGMNVKQAYEKHNKQSRNGILLNTRQEERGIYFHLSILFRLLATSDGPSPTP